ncbi:unnamed protein product [Paramecium pentaurelia]|uniref:Uncharacterized protein n=1 Tax=Paramecium pentaurelia TaxID=43138 RepID=A0A8S1UP95_9CILI|nr:unnamed protein product [Paramecium pentaurelia]
MNLKRDRIRVCSSVQIYNDLRKRRVKVIEAKQIFFPKIEEFFIQFLQSIISAYIVTKGQFVYKLRSYYGRGRCFSIGRLQNQIQQGYKRIINNLEFFTYFSNQTKKNNITQQSISKQQIPFLPQLQFIFEKLRQIFLQSRTVYLQQIPFLLKFNNQFYLEVQFILMKRMNYYYQYVIFFDFQRLNILLKLTFNVCLHQQSKASFHSNNFDKESKYKFLYSYWKQTPLCSYLD